VQILGNDNAELLSSIRINAESVRLRTDDLTVVNA